MWRLMKYVDFGKYENIAQWEGRKPSLVDIRYVIAGRDGEYYLFKTANTIKCLNSFVYTS